MIRMKWTHFSVTYSVMENWKLVIPLFSFSRAYKARGYPSIETNIGVHSRFHFPVKFVMFSFAHKCPWKIISRTILPINYGLFCRLKWTHEPWVPWVQENEIGYFKTLGKATDNHLFMQKNSVGIHDCLRTEATSHCVFKNQACTHMLLRVDGSL